MGVRIVNLEDETVEYDSREDKKQELPRPDYLDKDFDAEPRLEEHRFEPIPPEAFAALEEWFANRTPEEIAKLRLAVEEGIRRGNEEADRLIEKKVKDQ